jgi:CHAD domain-containing protein
VRKELFVKYINKLYREYNTQFKFAVKGAREQTVHNLRVLIKRFNALFAFLDEAGIYKKDSQLFFYQLKQFFKSAGNLRDIQVKKSLVMIYRNAHELELQEYETYLINRENTAKTGFFNKSSHYPKSGQTQAKKTIISAIQSFKQEELSIQAKSYILKRLRIIEKYLFKNNINKYLHKIRQTLKQLRYFIEIAQVCTDPNPMEEVDFNEIKEVEDILGSWNDRSVLRQDMERYNMYKQKLGGGLSDPDISRLLIIIEDDMKKMVSDLRPRLLRLMYHLKYLML